MSTVAVDPRIRARRVAVARDAGRRRLRRLQWLVGALVVAAAAVAVTWTPALDVDRVQVEGTFRTPPEEITDAAGVAPGDPLVWFDAGAAERAIARLPWIAEVRVDRRWPGTIEVAVVEREPAAAVATAEGTWLVADGTGRVVATSDAPPPDLMILDGVTAEGTVGDDLDQALADPLAVAAAVPSVLRDDLASVSGTGEAVEVRLDAGGIIVLGDAGEPEAKLRAAAAVLGAVRAACVGELDVSLPSSPALRRVPGCV